MSSVDPAAFLRDVELAFTAVLEAGEEGRAAALDTHCAGRPALRKEVEELLAAHGRAEGFITPPSSPPLTEVAAAAGEPGEQNEPDPHVGRRLSHYEIAAVISRGGMGIVYRARDVNLTRDVALKLLPPSLVADPAWRRRFVQEARAAATLEHPHIAAIYAIDEADGITFIAMELIRGETLAATLRGGRLPPPRALELAIEMAEGLACAHDRGLVHRDLKPGNVMLTADDHVKIIDFGLVKVTGTAGQGDAATATEAGKIMGTVAYMSPEQARGSTVDHRSDIFSFGIVLHEMLAGARPFHGQSDIDTLHAILHAPAPRLEARSQEGLPGVQHVVDRCLAKDPEARYSSMKEVISDLRSAWLPLAAGAGEGPKPPKKARPPDTAPDRLHLRGRAQWSKRHPDAVRQAIALFQEALEIDPMHARSHAGLADAYNMLGFLQVIPQRDVVPKARAAALRAIELDPGLAAPRASLGYLTAMFDWDWPAAQRHLQEAMRLDPLYPWAPHWYGVLVVTKSLDESLHYVTLARDLEPLSPIIHTAIGITHHLRRDYPAALRTYSQILDAQAAFAPAHYYTGLTFEQMGDYEEATAHFRRAAEIAGRGSLFLGALGHCYGRSGRRDLAEELLVEMADLQGKRYVSPYNVMLVRLGLGDTEAALQWLERALEDRSSGLWLTPVEPRFDGIRTDQRFRELVTRYGLEA
jgi:serine/threonine protein kinase/tetratricopeptide (TPR) repeat protein